jgi:hypothetical protein
MALLSFLRSVYDLDTLDTRLTNPSSVPYTGKSTAATDEGRNKKDDKRSGLAQTESSPPRWRTPEFFLYYLVLLVVVPYMFWIAYSVSGRMSSNLGPASLMAAANSYFLLDSMGPQIPQIRALPLRWMDPRSQDCMLPPFSPYARHSKSRYLGCFGSAVPSATAKLCGHGRSTPGAPPFAPRLGLHVERRTQRTRDQVGRRGCRGTEESARIV